MTSDITRYGIIVGVDGSQQADVAVRWAAKEAMLSGVPITLMYLLRPEIVTWPLAPSDRFSVESEIR
ncbi:universal stress protein, partial [Mycobacterium sp. ITM-2017-0098]